ncbi:MAG: hypothetical protein RRX92_00745 [Lachnospiraceae bacterium]
MKRKLIPPFFMLFAGAIASIVMYLMHYEIKTMLLVLLSVLFLFYILGTIAKSVLDSFEASRLKSIAADGEVIEKDAVDSTEQDGQESEDSVVAAKSNHTEED